MQRRTTSYGHRPKSASQEVRRRTVGGTADRRSDGGVNNPTAPSTNATIGHGTTNIQVYVRCRSRNQREIDEKSSVVISTMGPQGKEVILSSGSGGNTRIAQKTYSFDQVFGAESDQELVFDVTTKEYIQEMLDGYNCTVFAYGQTGTGKTYTMSGDINVIGDKDSPQVLLGEHAGIIPRVLKNLFQRLSSESNDYSVKVSFLELYNEKLTDLLAADDSEEETIRIFDNHASPPVVRSTGQRSSINNHQRPRQTADGNAANTRRSKTSHGIEKTPNEVLEGTNVSTMKNKNIQRHMKASTNSSIIVKGMEEIYIKSAYEGLELLTEGSLKRKVAATKCNDLSSRSHTIFTITTNITKTDPISGEQYVKIGKLNLVDLAGSENINRSGAENLRAQEAGLINKSLLTLGRVINALVDYSQHVPYRESKLTRLLQDSLGGKTKTCIIATISPAKISSEETVSTLEYAMRAKSIKNSPQVNQSMSKDVCLNEYVREIERLRHELKTSRLKDGIYVSQDQYELFESNEILLTEQKMRIHNMEEQTNKFKEEYVKQSAINKDLEAKITEVENTTQGLQEQKAALIEFMKNYETSTSKYINDVRKVHKCNSRVIDDLVGERDKHFEHSTYLQEQIKELQKTMSQEESMIEGLETDLKDSLVKIDDSIAVTNKTLHEQNNTTHTNAMKTLDALNSKQVNDIITSFQVEISTILEGLIENTDDSINSPYSEHRVLLDECFKRVSAALTLCTESLNKDLDNVITSARSDMSSVIDQFAKNESDIEETISIQKEEISRLLLVVKTKCEESDKLNEMLGNMERYYKEYIAKERDELFSDLTNSIEKFKMKQNTVDHQMLTHTKQEIVTFATNEREIRENAIKDISGASTTAITAVKHELQSSREIFNKHLQDVSHTIPSTIANISIIKPINNVLEQLAKCCGDDASKPLLSLLQNFKNARYNKQNTSINEISVALIQLKKHMDTEKQENSSLIKELESCLEKFYQYISNEYSSNMNDVSENHKSRISNISGSLHGIHERLMISTESKTAPSESLLTGNSENSRVRHLPHLERPANSEIYTSLKGENRLDTTIEGLSLENISPVHLSLSGIKFNPSTPVPVPDQPLTHAKVLMPRSVNTQNSRAYTVPMMLKQSPNRVSSPLKINNNLKRRFTLEPTNNDLSGDGKENNETIDSHNTPRKRLNLDENKL
ncbi:Kip1 protein [Maudiozyma humilis]|uniref:Kip1 protein n=1 Tax=Maudiozyma humilis TaxID=51915 RepID=A0AAV5S0D6_MAUHU|nr:Kip1 protein [Kazachstania humilis]